MADEFRYGTMASNKRLQVADSASGARSIQQKRRKQAEPFTRSHYNIGWVSALPIELAAGLVLLDDRHEALPKPVGDGNAYFYGTVGGHNVVMACLPDDLPCPSSATKVAADMCRSFTKLRLLLLVGIGGGIPQPGCDIRLGDVVVGRRVIQHDLGKEISGDRFEATGVACIPSRDVRTTLSTIKIRAEMGQNPLPRVLNELGSRGMVSKEYFDRSQLEDHLFEKDYGHVDNTSECSKCDITQRVQRPPRHSTDPHIHYGMIASGSQVVKNAKVRDEIGKSHQALCIEMAAAGLVHDFPFLAICGICNYADSHKNDRWQKYAATTAAAYGMEFLRNCQFIESSPEPVSSASHQRGELIKTLQFPRSKARYEDIPQVHPTTYAWFLRDPVYQEWLKPTNSTVPRGLLWIRGKPGVGKSTLMKYLFDEALTTAEPDDVVLGFFYHARGNLLERSVTGMYRSLIIQLLERDSGTVTVVDLFDDIEEEELVSNAKSLHRLFSRLVKAFDGPRLSVFIDALDEGDVDECQLMIENFEELASSARDQGIRFNVCFASRHHNSVNLDRSLQLVLGDPPGHPYDLKRLKAASSGL
ncbi:adenosylhomocysteine nucleosidase [Microdochium nivale]|nr:adenosylhomocysteine nucleosidase [Microdochium nivale]